MYTVHYTKHFTRGNLKGLDVPATVAFATLSAAKQFAEDLHEAKPCAGSGHFVVRRVTVQG